ncbi:MAG: FtsX-like permease family protein [bacterium]
MTGLASVFAILLVEIFLPTFNYLSGKQLSLNYSDSSFYSGLILIILLTGFISGLYPAFYLSAFKPLAVLKGRNLLFQNGGGTGKGSGRKILVVVQFSLSMILIIAATVVYKQLDFMRNTKLGFDKENLIYLPAKENIATKYQAVKNEMLQNPNIQAVTAKGSLPMFTLNHSTVDWEGKKTPRKIAMENTEVDYNYFEMLNLEFVAGRNFSNPYPTDATDAFIVNEEAVKIMGLEIPVGKRIKVAGKEGVIIGVVKNAHFKSLHHAIHPQVFSVLTDFTSAAMNLYGIILIKFRGNRVTKAIAAIKNIWNKMNPNSPFEYHFLDETIDNQYNAEKKISAILNYSTFLAVFISSLGLFSLASYTSEQRTKEIGIRKVLGASVSGIILLLNKEFTKWVLVANLIAWPIAYFAMNAWIQNFAYRIKIGPGIFLISGVIALVIALLTVSTHAIKAAFANPTDSLRYE